MMVRSRIVNLFIGADVSSTRSLTDDRFALMATAARGIRATISAHQNHLL